jgi:alpha-galactosidase
MRRLILGAALLLALGSAPLTGTPAEALPNRLALTPPMGWNDWNAFGCAVDEALVQGTADAMVASGLRDAGYRYVNIDDCWMAPARDGAGRLVPDPVRFPHGIAGVAAYVHARGLKLGIYESAGTATCAGYPGSLGHETTDAQSFAAWGVDYLKYDNCNHQNVPDRQRYEAMRDALAATGRPIVYSLCNWGLADVWTWGAGVGNLWRTTGDINASWGSLLSIFHANVGLAAYAGPDGWNDPDMLEVGNGMPFTEDRTGFSLWAQMAAPLLAGTDLRTATPATLSVYGNRDVIAVDQDTLGRQGRLVDLAGGLDVLAKPLAGGDVSVVLFNENAGRATVTTTPAAVGAPGAPSYRLTNLWSKVVTTATGTISASVPGHGVVMYRVTPGTGSSVGGTYGLVGASSARCLDVYGNRTAPGTAVEIWSCHGGANQRWTPTATGELRVQGGCLDAHDNGTAPGTRVQLWTCNGGANQQWRLNPDGTVTGVQSGLCLDVTGGDTPAGNVDGVLVELWTCNGGPNQQWALRP